MLKIMDPIVAAASVFFVDLAVGNGPIPEISFLNRVEIANSLVNAEKNFRGSITGNVSVMQSKQISSLFDALKICCTTAILGIEARKELVAYTIASLRELAPLVGKLSDYDTFIFIMRLIEQQKEEALLIYINRAFKFVKSSQFNSYKTMRGNRPADFRHFLEKHHISMARLPNGRKDNRGSNLVNCYYFFHFIAHIIAANNERNNVLAAPRLSRNNNNPLGLMSSRLLNVYGESQKERTELEIADRIAKTKQVDAAAKLKREGNWTEEQKKERSVEVATLYKAAGVLRKERKQQEHELWLSTLTEAERKLARPKPLDRNQLSRMTEREQLASRWLDNTYRAPRPAPASLLDPLAKEAWKIREKEKADAKKLLKESTWTAEQKQAWKIREKEKADAKKLLKESTWTAEQKQENKIKVAARLKASNAARKIKKQTEHELWLSTLTEAERKLARPNPIPEKELAKMTNQQQEDSRWLANTFRVKRNRQGLRGKGN
jgi:hypothetical protein